LTDAGNREMFPRYFEGVMPNSSGGTGMTLAQGSVRDTTDAARFIARCEQLWPGSMVIRPNKKDVNPVAYELKDLTGSLWANDNRSGENDPAYKGSAKIGGVEHWVSLWKKTSKNGKAYLSLSFKPKQEQIDRSRPLKDELSDEIPW
jgi:hypothetical protein